MHTPLSNKNYISPLYNSFHWGNGSMKTHINRYTKFIYINNALHTMREQQSQQQYGNNPFNGWPASETGLMGELHDSKK